MYRKRNHEQVSIDDFIPPFGGKLLADNRWVKLARVIPWERIEERYAKRFGKCGNVAYPLRLALGALIIKEKSGLTDEATVENISENVYMQYFIGYTEFRSGQPFAPSLMVEFRKRIDMKEIQKIIDEMDEENRKDEPPKRRGQKRGNPDDRRDLRAFGYPVSHRPEPSQRGDVKSWRISSTRCGKGLITSPV